MKKTMIISMLLTALIFGVFSSVAAAQNIDLTDIKGHWAQGDIEFMVGQGAINGYPDGTFKPNGTITRAEFSTILAKLMGASNNNNAFADAKGHWGEAAINGLVKEGVIVTSEYPNGFGPNEEITRIEMSRMVARGLSQESLLWKGVLIAFRGLGGFDLPFADQSDMSLADMPYIALANSSGIISGYEDGTFRMERSATRAESATMLKRYLDAKNKKPVLKELLDKFKAKPSVHNYSKAEMEAWIDRDADIARLGEHSINNEYGVSRTVAESNFTWIHPTGNLMSDRTEMATQQMNDMAGYMNAYYNREYKTIGDAWINEVRRYYKTAFNHNGVDFYTEDLPKMFEQFVQDAKDEKRISESIFVTDVSMVHLQQPDDWTSNMMVRGTQYIRYTSGTNLPDGVKLNKWYKRDIDVRFSMSTNEVSWETVNYPFYGEFPITSYQEVVNK